MKFIIEKKALTRMLRFLGSDPTKKAPSFPRREPASVWFRAGELSSFS